MARIKGQANYASNFEVLKQAPLDSRTVVSEFNDLLNSSTWQDADGNIWLYDGLIVTVTEPGDAGVGTYVLIDKDSYNYEYAWKKIGDAKDLEKKANLTNGKVPVNELPVATSLGNPNNATIPSTFAVNEAINNKIVGLLNWRGVKDTTAEIKAIAPAKKGDVWHSNEDGSEWVCTEDISTVNDSVWTELGTPIDLGGYYTKNEVDKKVKPLADSIGTDSDVASANGSVYARIKKNAADIATKASTAELNDVKDKVNTLNGRVDKNDEAIGTAEDIASSDGSLYARVKKNAADIATKASNSDLTALQSKVELKANQSDIPTAVQLVVKTI